MATNRLTITGDIGGAAMNSTITRTADGQINHDAAANLAKSGTLSTRTTDTTGMLTLATGHGIQTGDIIDVYWTGGRRYDVVVGTVVGDSVPISLGAGDVLPAQDDPVTAAKQQEIDTDFDGDKLVAIGSLLGQRGHLSFFNGSTNELALDLVAGELWHWMNGGTATNPLAGKTITHIEFTQATATAATFKLGILYDSTV